MRIVYISDTHTELLDEYATDGNVVPEEEITGKIDAIKNALGKGKDIKAASP